MNKYTVMVFGLDKWETIIVEAKAIVINESGALILYGDGTGIIRAFNRPQWKEIILDS